LRFVTLHANRSFFYQLVLYLATMQQPPKKKMEDKGSEDEETELQRVAKFSLQSLSAVMNDPSQRSSSASRAAPTTHSRTSSSSTLSSSALETAKELELYIAEVNEVFFLKTSFNIFNLLFASRLVVISSLFINHFMSHLLFFPSCKNSFSVPTHQRRRKRTGVGQQCPSKPSTACSTTFKPCPRYNQHEQPVDVVKLAVSLLKWPFPCVMIARYSWMSFSRNGMPHRCIFKRTSRSVTRRRSSRLATRSDPPPLFSSKRR
jgi:hypothetical protein